MDLVTVLIAGVVLLIIYRWFSRSQTNLPPFPARPLPIVGNLLSIKKDMSYMCTIWRKQCGDIFSLYLGGMYVVVLNGYDVIKEALVTNGDSMCDRPPFFLDTATGLAGVGMNFSSGNYWKEQRSVTVSILRAFGMGTNVLAEKVNDERILFTEQLKKLKGKPTDIQLLIYVSMSNIICSILIGQRFEYDDKEFQILMRALRDMIRYQQTVSLVNFLPWLQYLPGDFFNAKKIATCSQQLLNIFAMFLEKKRRDVSDITEIDNFIDAYIIEKNKLIKAGVPTYLDDISLKKLMLDLFEAGTETTSTTIYWCVLYMIVHPNIQEKVYQEIKDKVGIERTPTMQDKTQMNYLNAVIHETQRLANIISLGVPRLTSVEVTLRGYTIPKGTTIISNLDSVLHNTTTWGDDAAKFRPERFIDENGQFNVHEEFIPYSLGRRSCPGESIARTELFLFLSSMFQRFQFLPSDAKNLPPMDAIIGIVASPTPYEVIVKERN